MTEKKAIEIIDSEIDFKKNDTSGQRETLIYLLCQYGYDEQLETLRNELRAFAYLMEDKLKYNDDKGGWDDCSSGYLYKQITKQHELLAEAILDDNIQEIQKRSINIANYSMMIQLNSRS